MKTEQVTLLSKATDSSVFVKRITWSFAAPFWTYQMACRAASDSTGPDTGPLLTRQTAQRGLIDCKLPCVGAHVPTPALSLYSAVLLAYS